MTAEGSKTSTFADIVTLIDPVAAKCLPASALQALGPIASRLPPIPCGGFEFSLLDNAPIVDLMQCHMLDERGRQRLATFIESDARAKGQPWKWLADLIDGDVTGLHCVWLEFDADAGPHAPPAIFLEFDRINPPHSDRLLDLVADIPLAAKANKVSAVREVMDLLPGDTHVSHLGAMFSRPDTPMRVNIKRLKSHQLENFLKRLGLEVPSFEGSRLLERAYRGTICLDYLDGWLPRFGIEYSFTSWPQREAGWRELGELVAQGRIDPAKWQAFLGWAGVISPLDSLSEWPSSCILDELCHPGPARSIIECGPSHIKATFDPTGLQSLKGYVGFRPALLLPDNSSIPGDAPQPRPLTGKRTLDRAIASGVDFLLAERTQDGLWRDFNFGNLASDEWVSGYIGAHLAELRNDDGRHAALQAWHILRERREQGAGWGYHRATPPDADSTAWIIILARRLGLDTEPQVSANMPFMAQHLDRHGAAATYSEAVLERIDHRLPNTRAHRQWCKAHAEVTASAALAGLEPAMQNLIGSQGPDGSWPSFWIETDAYATGVACEALAHAAAPEAGHCIESAARWAIAHVDRAGIGAFERSWLLRIALHDDRFHDDQKVHEAMRVLLREQRADGSWDADCAMLVPVMDARCEREQTAVALDIHRNFTTATVIGTMDRARRCVSALQSA